MISLIILRGRADRFVEQKNHHHAITNMAFYLFELVYLEEAAHQGREDSSSP